MLLLINCVKGGEKSVQNQINLLLIKSFHFKDGLTENELKAVQVFCFWGLRSRRKIICTLRRSDAEDKVVRVSMERLIKDIQELTPLRCWAASVIMKYPS